MFKVLQMLSVAGVGVGLLLAGSGTAQARDWTCDATVVADGAEASVVLQWTMSGPLLADRQARCLSHFRSNYIDNSAIFDRLVFSAQRQEDICASDGNVLISLTYSTPSRDKAWQETFNAPYPNCPSEEVDVDFPPYLDGMELWLRADEGVAASGGRISLWEDQSGNGHDATMSTASRQPFFAPSALNGYPAVRFDGAQSLYIVDDVSPSEFTIFVAGKNDASSGFSMILGPGGNSPNNQLRWESPDSVLMVGLGNDLPETTTPVGNTRVYHALAVRYDGGTLSTYRDGVLVSSAAVSTTGPWTFRQVGGWFSSFFARASIAEVMVYDEALAPSDLDGVSDYLSNRYDLP